MGITNSGCRPGGTIRNLLRRVKVMTATDLLINEGDYLLLGSLIVDGKLLDRSYNDCAVKVLAIDFPLIKIETYGDERSVNLQEYPNYRKISNKTI